MNFLTRLFYILLGLTLGLAAQKPAHACGLSNLFADEFGDANERNEYVIPKEQL